MKKQIFTIMILLIGGVASFGQFKLDGGTQSLRLQTGGVDRLFVTPNNYSVPIGNVGINTITPDAKFTINGDMSFKNSTRFTTNGGYTATNRNGSSVLIFEAGGTLNGIAGGVDGMLLYVLCGYKMPSTTTTGALVIKHEESTFETVAANRIMTHTGADFTITSGVGGVMMVYDGGRQRWRIMEVTSGSGSFSGWGLTGNSGTNPATNAIGTNDNQDLVFKTNNQEKMRLDSLNGTLTLKSINYNAIFGNKANGTYSSPTAVTDGSSLLKLVGYGYNGSTYTPASGIEFESIGSYPANNAVGGRIIFSTTGPYSPPIHSGQYLERMRIDNTGRVGIGTTTPTAKLDVDGDIVVRKTTITTPGAIDALNRNGASSLYFASDGITTLRGIAGGQDGMLLFIFTGLNTTLNLIHESSLALSADQITTNTGATVTISGRGGATLIYDSYIAKWRVIGIAQ